MTEKLEDKLQKLGNIIGDVLSMIEQEAINATKILLLKDRSWN